MSHWSSADDSDVGTEEEPVAAVGVGVVLGASSRGVRVVVSFDSWRCKKDGL